MGKRYIFTNLVVLAIVGIITGCQHKDVDVLDREPNLQGTYIPLSGYQAQAIEAAGGLNAWTNVIKLHLDSLVTFYQPDGSFYLTEQKYIVYPWSNSIEIFGSEPNGNFAWRLSKGQFEVLKGLEQIPSAKSVINNKCFIEAILTIISAPICFLDKSDEFSEDTNPIKIQGQWYHPIVRHRRTDIESNFSVPNAVFYQNRENSIIEMIAIDCPGVDHFFTVRGYDYGRIKDGDIIIPQRIEIFLTDSQNSSQRRLVKIDIK